jgi:hypothetical protein
LLWNFVQKKLFGGFCIHREKWEVSGAIRACSEHQHLKNLYLVVAGSVFILWGILIGRGRKYYCWNRDRGLN